MGRDLTRDALRKLKLALDADLADEVWKKTE
jgi:hypothetical protein